MLVGILFVLLIIVPMLAPPLVILVIFGFCFHRYITAYPDESNTPRYLVPLFISGILSIIVLICFKNWHWFY